MTNERRQFKRFEILLIVDIQPHSEPSSFFFGITKNISFEGFIFESQNCNLKPGDILEFKLKHPENDLSLTAVGEIIWEKKTKYEYLAGVKYRKMNEEIKSKISKLVSTDKDIVTETDRTESTIDFMDHDDKSRTNDQIEKQAELQPDISRTLNNKIPEQNRESSVHKAVILIAAITVVASLSFVFWKSRVNVDPSALTASNDAAVEDIEYDPEINIHALQDAPGSGLPDISQESNDLSEPEEIAETEPPPADQEPSLNVENELIVPNEENIQEIQKPEKSDKTAGKINQQPNGKQSEDSDRTRIIKYYAKPRKYFVQVGAWKNPDLAKKVLSELKKDYSEASSLSKNNFQIIIIPNILTKSRANAISKEIGNKFDLKPLVVVMHKDAEIIDRDLTSTNSKANEQQAVAEIAVEPIIEAIVDSTNETEIAHETGKPDYTSNIIIDPLDKDFISYEDLFDDNSNNWDIFDLEEASARIENGFYYIENKKAEGKLFILHDYPFPHERDFIIEAFINAVSITNDHSYGFVFGARDALDNYYFQINNNGHYSVTKNHVNSSQDLIRGQINGLPSGNNSLVSLKIAKLDNHMFFYINDNYVNKVSNLTFFGNKIGFVLEGSSVIAIDRTRSYIKQERQIH